MRRTLLMIAAFALLLTQCRKPVVEYPTAEPTNENMVSMTVTVGHGGKTDITDAGVITWSAGDKLYVGDGEKYIGFLTLVGDGGSATGTFTGTVSATAGDYTFGFYYLGSNPLAVESGATSVDISFASQTGVLTDASSCHIGYGTANGKVEDGNVILASTDPVTMTSKVAIAYFEFKKDDDSGYEGAITLSGTNICNSMTVGFNGSFSGTTGTAGKAISLTNTSSSKKYVMLVPTGTVEETLEFGGAYEGTTKFYKGIEANKFYCLGAGEPIAVMVKVLVPVESVSLNKTSLSLTMGSTEILTATVAPDDATNKSVTWNSDNTDVATVDGTGKVTAVAAVGTATITVTTEDGSKTAKCTVTVTPVFTVNKASVTTVTFAPGNLYYDGTTDNKWKFEANQWDFRTYKSKGSCINGTYNSSGGTPTNDWGLFGWSGSTGSATYGKNTSKTNSDYSGDFNDWGGITDLPDNADGKTWRTLTINEWRNLLGMTGGTSPRDNAASLRAWVTLDNGVSGLVILPDGSTVTASTVTTTALVASSGAVFLPAAAMRSGVQVVGVGTSGYYMSSDSDDADTYYYCYFTSGTVYYNGGINRCKGAAVRLVR